MKINKNKSVQAPSCLTQSETKIAISTEVAIRFMASNGIIKRFKYNFSELEIGIQRVCESSVLYYF